MYSKSVIVFLALVAAAFACDTKWPNGTDTKVSWYQCNNGPIAFFNVTPFDADGRSLINIFQFSHSKLRNYEYPVHLSKPLIIKADINNPKTTYGSPALKQTTNIWSWSSSCSWSSVPTFGMLKNLDACTNGIPCPIKTGRQYLNILNDFSPY
ncbi:unnamed protein product, partial [Cylicostephanus goldi]